jgi:hypothetical protein
MNPDTIEIIRILNVFEEPDEVDDLVIEVMTPDGPEELSVSWQEFWQLTEELEESPANVIWELEDE